MVVSLGRLQVIEGHELDGQAREWEEIVVYDNVDVVDKPVPKVY